MALDDFLEVKKYDSVLYKWDGNELTSLIVNISRDLLARACYDCLFYCKIQRDVKTVGLFILYVAWMVKILLSS